MDYDIFSIILVHQAYITLAFALAGYVPYVWAISAGTVKPTASTYASWGILNIAIMISQYMADATSPQVIGYTVGGTIMGLFILIYQKDKVKAEWSRMDSRCVAFAFISSATLLWLDMPIIAVLINMITTFVASTSLMRNLYREPWREPLVPWLFWFVGSAWEACTGAHTPAVLLPSLTFLIIQAIVICLIKRRPRVHVIT